MLGCIEGGLSGLNIRNGNSMRVVRRNSRAKLGAMRGHGGLTAESCKWDAGEKYSRAEVGKLHTRQQERSNWRAVAPIQSITEVTSCADVDGQTRRGGRWPGHCG